MKLKPISLTVPVTIQAAEKGSDVRRFELVAYTGEPMQICYWDDPVVIDCASLVLDIQSIPALYDHIPDSNFIVGQVQEISVASGLPPITARGIFTPTANERDMAREVLAKADAGFKWQASVGGSPASVERFKAGEKVTVNGREYTGPVSVARGVTLREISFVVLGGDRRSSAIVARHKPIKGAAMSYEEWLTSLGFDSEAQAAFSEVQTANMQGLYAEEYGETETETETETNPAPDPANPPADPPTNARAKPPAIQATGGTDPVMAERQRHAAITAAVAKYGNPTMLANGVRVPVAAHAIAQGWDVTQAEIQAMRSQLPVAPANVQVKGGASLQMIQGAMILKCGGRLDHKSYTTTAAVDKLPRWLRASINDATRNQIMEEAHHLSDMSAVDICAAALRASGKDVPRGRDEMIRAAFSSASLSNVMTTSVNAILMATYFDSPDTTIGWVVENDVADYKLNERPRVLKGNELTPQPEDATADHDTMEDVRETYKVERFSRQFMVDEIAIINDSLGAINEKPTEFGNAARRLRPNLVYGTLLANPSLNATGRPVFNATDGSLRTGSAFSKANLSAALAQMTLITENNVNIDVSPTHLIVPPTLRDDAVNLVGSPMLIATGTAGTVTQLGTNNPIKDWGLTAIPEKRLENGVVMPSTKTRYAGSSSTWFVVSAIAPAIEVGYLRGTGRAPRVRSWTMEKEGVFGVGWDVSLSIGVCVRDYKGLQKNTA